MGKGRGSTELSRTVKYISTVLLVFIGLYYVAILTYDQDIKFHIFNEGYRDAIDAATQLGRLDVISALLGIVGILLAIFGLIGFAYVRLRSEAIAVETATEVAMRVATEVAEKEIREYRDRTSDLGFTTITDRHGNVVHKQFDDFKTDNGDITEEGSGL